MRKAEAATYAGLAIGLAVLVACTGGPAAMVEKPMADTLEEASRVARFAAEKDPKRRAYLAMLAALDDEIAEFTAALQADLPGTRR